MSLLDELRKQYNATVKDVVRCHDELAILRVVPDGGVPRYEAGQYTTLGLGNWEPRAADAQPESAEATQTPALIKRAYSISCPMLDEEGRLRRPSETPWLEFYVTLVRFNRPGRPPALTPRLFMLEAGDRLFCAPRAYGTYTLRHVQPDDTVVLAATGTGEAPHNAMAAELLGTGHRGRIVVVTTARLKKDLAYLPTHRRLEAQFAHYRYLALTTREPENIDPQAPGYCGKRYLQDYFASGALEQDAGITLDPRSTHVYLCGNPQMIGAPRGKEGDEYLYPEPLGMVEVLQRRGFRIDEPHRPGNIHYEKYW